MARKANVRVEAKRLPSNASKAERDKALTTLLRILKRACNEYGVSASLKEREFFVRKCDIRRRKRQMRLRVTQEGAEGLLDNNKERRDFV